MNNYPSWWNETLTIYNKFTDPQTRVITWYRSVVDNSFWKYIGNKISVGDTILETNNTICRIPKNDRFLEKYKWVQTVNDEMANYFTLGNGDIIVKGEVDDEIDEYTSGHRSSDLLTKYKNLQGCMVIERVAINVDGGRGNEHYYVRGV